MNAESLEAFPKSELRNTCPLTQGVWGSGTNYPSSFDSHWESGFGVLLFLFAVTIGHHSPGLRSTALVERIFSKCFC